MIDIFFLLKQIHLMIIIHYLKNKLFITIFFLYFFILSTIHSVYAKENMKGVELKMKELESSLFNY